MKTKITLLLALILVIGAISGCGEKAKSTSNSDQTTKTETTEEQSEEKSEDIFNMGETVSTGVVDISLDSVEFFDCLFNVKNEDYLTQIPKDDPRAETCYRSDNPYYAKDNETVVKVTYTIKNTGKEKVHSIDRFEVDYNDGYTFELPSASDTWDADFNQYVNSGDIEPLSDSVTYLNALVVPVEVKDNTSAPLLVKFDVPYEDGSYKTVNFKVR